MASAERHDVRSEAELALVQLDQILRLAARAIEAFVEPFGRAVLEVGDDEADVEAEPRRLDAGDGAPLLSQDPALWRVSA